MVVVCVEGDLCRWTLLAVADACLSPASAKSSADQSRRRKRATLDREDKHCRLLSRYTRTINHDGSL
jgi:hypothetical protein